MRELVFEILLRLSKALAAAIARAARSGWSPSGRSAHQARVDLALLCWLSGAAFILLVEESPI